MAKKCSNQPFLILMQTSRAIQERIRDDMMKNNLSITEFSVLEVLFHKGKQTIHQIGKSILITSGSMTYVIDKLEQKGLLKRSACPDDRRAIHVSLTTAGSELLNRIMPEHEDCVDSIFDSLNSQEVDTLIDLLKKVKEKVED
ncbi:MarR family transcriptional regulator [Fredinandcohnia sp. QZ13]|uniref:MarR family winged helix-turn-helix transcriptional regulator n=1 Tax=Fredinandcohnia sp. QZ13 TaxID=3073144 RepID=UPI0028536EB1|nr:MarR family transcriptional regulator [Fredinandcohnia sp. QZ13]MDR4888330.1 MarR family transcriptional regulator [Fredinandcohnia sp. QZ13]